MFFFYSVTTLQHELAISADAVQKANRAAAESAREAAVHKERWRQAQVCDASKYYVF